MLKNPNVLPVGTLAGIGIDLVSWSRIKRFLADHSFEDLKRLLTPSEQNSFQNSAEPVQFFGRCFAAKEAYFKASHESLLADESFFQKVEVVMKPEDRFEVTSQFSNSTGKDYAEGMFFETSDGAGARLLLFRENDLS